MLGTSRTGCQLQFNTAINNENTVVIVLGVYDRLPALRATRAIRANVELETKFVIFINILDISRDYSPFYLGSQFCSSDNLTVSASL